MKLQRVPTPVFATVLALGSLAACGGDDAVSVADAWARTSAAGQTSGAVYFDLTVDNDDVLLGASVPGSVAARAEVHEVVQAEMDMDGEMDDDMAEGEMDEGEMDDMAEGEMGDMDGEMDDMEHMDGAMTMRELESGLALTAGETVSFEPGGYHVMLFDLAQPLATGDEVELTLRFAEAGDRTLTVTVADESP